MIAPPVPQMMPSAASNFKEKEEKVIPQSEREVKENQYSPDEASAVLQSAIAPQAKLVQIPQEFIPPLAPKKAPLVDLDQFEKTEGEQSTPKESDSISEMPAGEGEVVVPEKIMYQALCATCETPIEVPFKPDGSRPTFCKDCLRDYQRATAKARNEIEKKQGATLTNHSGGSRNESTSERDDTRKRISPRTYTSATAPISLAQTKHIEPKRFKALQKRQPDLKELRSLIEQAKSSQGGATTEESA